MGLVGWLVSRTLIRLRCHFLSQSATFALSLDLVYNLWPADLNKTYAIFNEWENKNVIPGKDKLCDFSLRDRIDGRKFFLTSERPLHMFLKILCFSPWSSWTYVLAFLVTRSWYTDSVVVFGHVFIYSYRRYLQARVLRTWHCAGYLGCTREWKKSWFLSSGVCRFLVWDKVKRKGCLSSGDLLGVVVQRKRPGLQRRQSSPGKLDIRRHRYLSHVSLWKSSISLHLWICLEVRPCQPIWLTHVGCLCCFA